jgi:hypothetical protein
MLPRAEALGYGSLGYGTTEPLLRDPGLQALGNGFEIEGRIDVYFQL